MPEVSTYWDAAGGDYFADTSAALKWLLSRYGPAPSNWLGNALFTQGATSYATTPPDTSGFIEAGLSSQVNFITGVSTSGTVAQPFNQSQIENITFVLPSGLYPDTQLGPDGYVINDSIQSLPWGTDIVNTYAVTTQLQSYIENQLYTAGSPYISPGDPHTAGVVAKWQPNTFYRFGSLIVDSNDNVQIALLNGTTCGGTTACHNTNHPNWPTTPIGSLTGDYTQVWKLLWTGYTNIKWVALGYVFNLLQAKSYYRVDLFVYNGGTYYYQGSSDLYGTALGGNQIPNSGTFSVGGISQLGNIIGVLYPTSVTQPSPGSTYTAIPAGWVSHSNIGIGYKLTDYKAQIYYDNSGSETLQEDNIPIIVQSDEYHARAGSSGWLDSGSGTPTVRILYNDPILGYTEVFDSLSGLSSLSGLVRSYDVPTNDPLYVPNPTSAGSPAIQNRSLSYDNALAILAFAVSGNYTSALTIINTVNTLLSGFGGIVSGGLARSYDRLFSRVDQANVDTGTIAWMCLGYATYMQLSGDYAAWSELQSMLNLLVNLISADADARDHLLYAGYDASGTPLTNVQTSDNIIAWFAFERCSPVLNAAASSLLKINQITSAQSTSLTTLATNLLTYAGNIWTALDALYIAPAGSIPGHFPHGVTNTGSVDTSEDADATGSWMAILCDANGDDTKALQCLEYVYTTFLLTGQTVVLSSASDSYNETYSTSTLFDGIKPYNDSAGGYSGSPLSVSMEQSWGYILSLLWLYSIPGLIDYFSGISTDIDTVIQELVTGQYTVFKITNDGSLLAYSLSARATWGFYVWPWVAAVAWMYMVETNQGSLLSASLQSTLLPNLRIPTGANQTIDDTQGTSSLGTFQVRCNDTTGLLRSLVGEQALIGQTVTFRMGFPGLQLGDFVPMHTMQIHETGSDKDGWVTFTLQDVQRFYGGSYIWTSGGPNTYLQGDPTTVPPAGAAWLPNAFAVSDKNPRWLGGNPIDLYIAAMQNELGVGQDPALDAILSTSSVNTASISAANPLWQKYIPGDDTTIINPNQYLDIPALLALRDGMFSGDWFQFKITSPFQAKSWLEQYILKPLGLVTVVKSNGQITLKTLKNPEDQTPVYNFTRNNIIGIPDVNRAKTINAITFRFDSDDSIPMTAARTYENQVSYEQTTSIKQYDYIYRNQVEATGMRSAYDAYGRAFLLADYLFRRYAFSTPIYTVTAQLASCLIEIKDYATLTHPLVEDLINKRLGITNVLCEVIARTPDYSNGRMTYKLIDTRPMQMTYPYLISCGDVPDYSYATAEQQATYAFVGENYIF